MKNRQKETFFFVLEEQKGWNLEPAAKIQRKKGVISDHKSLVKVGIAFQTDRKTFHLLLWPSKI